MSLNCVPYIVCCCSNWKETDQTQRKYSIIIWEEQQHIDTEIWRNWAVKILIEEGIMFISTENQWLFIIHTFIQIEATLSDEMTNESFLYKIDNFRESSV